MTGYKFTGSEIVTPFFMQKIGVWVNSFLHIFFSKIVILILGYSNVYYWSLNILWKFGEVWIINKKVIGILVTKNSENKKTEITKKNDKNNENINEK